MRGWVFSNLALLDALMSPDLNRHSLSRQIADQVDGLSIQMAAAALDACLDRIAHAIAQGGSVRLAGFGTFSSRQRKRRTTRHPRTQALLEIPATWIPTFSPSPQLQDRLRAAKSQSEEIS